MNTGQIDIILLLANALKDRLLASFDDGEITWSEFKEQFRDQMASIYADAATASTSGRQLSAAQQTLVDERLAEQLERGGEFSLEELFDEYENGFITLGRFRARLGLYLNSARSLSWQVWTLDQGEQMAERVLDPGAIHCIPCVMYSFLPPQPIRNVIPPGQACTCLNNCKCSIRLV